MRVVFARALVIALLAAAGTAFAQDSTGLSRSIPTRAADLREEVQRITVRVRDLYGREEERSIAVTIFRPPGEGPFPLAIMSHGRAVASRRQEQGRQRYENLSRWLVGKGFAVFVPTRVGYGDTYGVFDPEYPGLCDAPRYGPMATAASDQVLATLKLAKSLPYVDTTRWLALGQSVGGLTTLAVVSRKPEGLAAAINFSGGSGGDPDNRPGDSCGVPNLEQLWRQQAAGNPQLPTLWLYWAHDRYWGKAAPQRWARAWRDGGGTVEFHQLPPWSDDAVDGHSGIAGDMRHWTPLAEAYLSRLGLLRGSAAGAGQ